MCEGGYLSVAAEEPSLAFGLPIPAWTQDVFSAAPNSPDLTSNGVARRGVDGGPLDLARPVPLAWHQ